jgi:hypothetical protein
MLLARALVEAEFKAQHPISSGSIAAVGYRLILSL